MKRSTIPLFVAMACGALSSVANAQAPAKLYVAPGGDDSASGTLTTPLKSLGKAVSLLRPGSTLYLRDGIYAETVVVSASGTAAAPITIAAYPGEVPIVDGEGRLPMKQYGTLVRITGSYVRMDGLKIRNSTDSGLVLDGDHDVASHLNVHHNMEAGVLARGNDTIVEYSIIWQNAYRNCRKTTCPASPYQEGRWATGLSAARNPHDAIEITHNAILRHNTAYNNWGEGISSYEAEGTVMEDNIAYDNWANDYYISDSSNVLFQRNLGYFSKAYKIGRGTQCIEIADERASKPRSAHNKIINNICQNGSIDAFPWTGVPGSGLVDDLIANNTVVNGRFKVGGSVPIVNSNTRVVNNVFIFDGAIASVSEGGGIEFSHNLWSTKPVDVAMGTDSIVANPMLSQPAVGGAGNVKLSDFVPSPKSPARGAGLDLGKTVSTDALGHPRSSHPTCGAIEILP